MDTPAPIQKPSTSKLPIILLVISALGLFATTVLLSFQNTQLQSQITTLESKISAKPISTPTPTPTPNTSDKWIQYKNEKYGYSIEYPPKWSQSSESESNQSNTYFLNVVDDLNPSFGGLDQTQILVVASSDTLKYPKISKLHDLGIKKYTNISGRLYSWESVSEGNKIKVDRKGFDFIAEPGSYNLLFRIFSTPEKEKSDQLVFEQLLNSFKLNNQENKFCGGIAAIPCPSGFSCKLDGTYPDAGGKCEVDNQKGTLEAVVIVSPTCPGAMRPDDDCEGPYPSRPLTIINLADKKTTTVKTDKEGKFTIALNAGSYKLQNTTSGIGKDIKNPTFIITAGKTTNQRFDIDSGIR